MNNFFTVLIAISIICIPVFIILALVKLIRKRPAKKFFIGSGVFAVMLIAGFVGFGLTMDWSELEAEIPESIEIAIPDYQEEYDINTDIPIEVSILPEGVKTDNLKYIADKAAITFSDSGIITGSKEGSYDIYIECGKIKSNSITITVVDMDAREMAEKEAEEQRLAEETALAEAQQKAEEEAALAEAQQKAAEEAALAEAQQKAAEEAALAEAQQKAAEEAALAEAQQKTTEEKPRKQVEDENTDVTSQETTRMYASSNLNIRSSNNTNSEILGRLSVNDTVDVISTDGDWATILYNDNIAYAASAYLSSSKITVPTESSTNEVGEQVWIPRTGSKYHRNSSCSGMKNPSQVSKSKAESLGYEPCKKCY